MSSKKHNRFRNSPSSTHNNSSKTEAIAPNQPVVQVTDSSSSVTHGVQPEQMSLNAYDYIQGYLHSCKKQKLDKNDLNAVLRLSQHLRVFGLLSAVGYANQSNSQENNETRKRTVPVWESLLGQLIDQAHPPTCEELMQQIKQIAKEQPSRYMAIWRKSLILANHWNFWARAHQED